MLSRVGEQRGTLPRSTCQVTRSAVPEWLFCKWLEISSHLAWQNLGQPQQVSWAVGGAGEENPAIHEKTFACRKKKQAMAKQKQADNLDKNAQGQSQNTCWQCQAGAHLEQPWKRKIPYRGEAEGHSPVKCMTNWCWDTKGSRLVHSWGSRWAAERRGTMGKT